MRKLQPVHFAASALCNMCTLHVIMFIVWYAQSQQDMTDQLDRPAERTSSLYLKLLEISWIEVWTDFLIYGWDIS